MASFTGSDKAISFLFDMVANIADDYDATATYAVNDYAIYEGVLYKCTSAITTAETFTPAHWTAVLVMNEISAGGGGGGSTTLAGLTDVALASVANGDVLTYDSTLSKWKNAAGSGGGGVNVTIYTVADMVDSWGDGFGPLPTNYQLNTQFLDSNIGLVVIGNFALFRFFWTTTGNHTSIPSMGYNIVTFNETVSAILERSNVVKNGASIYETSMWGLNTGNQYEGMYMLSGSSNSYKSRVYCYNNGTSKLGFYEQTTAVATSGKLFEIFVPMILTPAA